MCGFLCILLMPEASVAQSIAGDKTRSTTLCGWVDNPTPGNWSLTDREREWTITTLGATSALAEEDLDKIPDFGKHWVVTNMGGYGFGCACMKVRTDISHHSILAIRHVTVLPIAHCKKDSQLPQKNRPGSSKEFLKSRHEEDKALLQPSQ